MLIDSVFTTSDAYIGGRIAGLPALAGAAAAGGIVINIGIRSLGGAATLYHFTSGANEAQIAVDGVIAP